MNRTWRMCVQRVAKKKNNIFNCNAIIVARRCTSVVISYVSLWTDKVHAKITIPRYVDRGRRIIVTLRGPQSIDVTRQVICISRICSFLVVNYRQTVHRVTSTSGRIFLFSPTADVFYKRPHYGWASEIGIAQPADHVYTSLALLVRAPRSIVHVCVVHCEASFMTILCSVEMWLENP